MDDSWCRVLVSDEPNYRDYQEAIASAVDPAYPGPMVTRDPQLVTEWSPHQIECTLRIGGRASFVGEFLYVVTDSDVQLKIGEFTA